MGFSWGGFSQGMNQGLQLGSKLNGLIEEDQVTRLRKQGMDEAKASALAAQGAAASSVTDNGVQGLNQSAAEAPMTAPVQTYKVDAPEAAPQTAPDSAEQAMPTGGNAPPSPAALAAGGTAAIPAQQRYSSGMRGFDSKDAAVAHAKSKAPTDMDFFMKNAVPQIAAKYMEQGNMAKADAWTQYAQDKSTQQHMQTWAKAKRAADSGDFESAAEHLGTLHKQFDDGMSVIGQEAVKDQDGNLTGFNLKIKNDATGETRAQFVDPKTLVETGLQGLAPPQLFDMTYKRQMAADAQRARAAIDKANDQRTLDKELAVQGVKENRQDKRTIYQADREDKRVTAQEAAVLERQKAKDNSLGSTGKTLRDLKAAGWSDAEIKDHVNRDPRTMGLAPNPEKTASMVYGKLAADQITKFDVPDAAGKSVKLRFSQMSDAQKQDLVKRQVAMIQSVSPKASPVAAASGASYQGAPIYNPDDEE